jgi:7,8-dihydropterin-6-yl-methyl-4-(beta-D-ribofuranosyl)aminobenzene 5'-phosphate synthase
MDVLLTGAGIVVLVPVVLLAFLEIRYLAGRKAADQAWEDERPERLKDLGTTRSLEILPLVDWSPSRPVLRGEAGVSYLIKTDRSVILMDVGLNFPASDPSPLQHNMRELGIRLDDFDTIVISHRHVDHVGGLRWLRRNTFSLGNVQVDLAGKRVFSPVPMSYPGLVPRCTRTATAIAPGVATIGTITGMLFMGRIDEQALAIAVEGKGIVLVVGCGHQSVPRILERTAQLFDAPIYGIIGGLHFPCPHGRAMRFGIDLQNLLVYGLLHRPDRRDVERDIAMLARHEPQWVSLSPHDSSDEVIARFRHTFGSRYHELRVGDWLKVAVRPREGPAAAVS